MSKFENYDETTGIRALMTAELDHVSGAGPLTGIVKNAAKAATYGVAVEGKTPC